MNGADSFLRAIFRKPHDDAPRLIYADWLDEMGEESAAELRQRGKLEMVVCKNRRKGRNRIWSKGFLVALYWCSRPAFSCTRLGELRIESLPICARWHDTLTCTKDSVFIRNEIGPSFWMCSKHAASKFGEFVNSIGYEVRFQEALKAAVR